MDGLKLVGSQRPPEDVQQVLDASAYLRISEFDVFRLAWERWTGEIADERWLERIFADYMFKHVVPGWVRHFVREVMNRVAAGYLDRAEFGADRVRRREPFPPPTRHQAWVPFAVFAAFFLVIVGMKQGPQAPGALACELGPGMRHLSFVAYTMSAQPLPKCLQ